MSFTTAGISFQVIHTPGHTPGGICLYCKDEGLLFVGDTLFAGAWGRTDLPGGDAEAMVESLSRLATLEDGLTVLPGHGGQTTIGREKPWLQMVAQDRKLPF